LAGLRSGRLSVALEGIAKTTRRVADTRRVMLVAMIYPFVVLFVAVVVFQFTMTTTVPVIHDTFDDLEVMLPRWYTTMSWFAELLVAALPWISRASFLAMIVFLVWISRASVLSARGGYRRSTLGQILRAGRLATFAETLALLIEQDLPLAEALELSCESSGDRELHRAVVDLAESIRQGQTMRQLPAGFPPMFGFLLMSGGRPGQLVATLRRLAENYRRRAARLSGWLSIVLPMMLSVGICGFVVATYVLLAMAPFILLLHQMSLPS